MRPLLLLLLLLPAASAAQSPVTATADRSEMQVLDVLSLEVQATGGNVQAPDLEAAGWRLVGQSQRMSIVNGRSSSSLHLQLQAVRAGNLVIGPFTVDVGGQRYQSRPIPIKVQDEGETSGAAGAPPPTEAPRDESAWLQWGVDGSEVWLGQEVQARLYLFIDPRVRLSDVNVSDVNLEGFWTEHSGQRRSARRQIQVGGRVFNRIELGYYHLFPLRAGELLLPAVEATLQVRSGAGFSRRTQSAKRVSQPLPLTVKALPQQGRPPGFGGPAVGQVGVEARLDRTAINADEGVQLTVQTRIRSGRIETVPEVVLPPLDDFKAFPPTSDANSRPDGGHINGFRTQTWLLKPKKGGRLALPTLKVPYFDPQAGRYRVAQARGQVVTVRGAPTEAAAGKVKGIPDQKSELALHTIRKAPDLDARDTPLHRSWWFLLALLLPPVGLLGAIGRDRYLAHVGATAGGRAARRAGGEAQAALARVPREPSEAYAAVARALLVYLEARFGIAARGLTHAQLSDALRAEGVPDGLVRDLVSELENCDFARFAPAADVGAVDAAVERATSLLDRIEGVQ